MSGCKLRYLQEKLVRNMMKSYFSSLLACLLIASCTGEHSSVAGEEDFYDAPGLEVMEQKNEFGHVEKIQRRIADGTRHGRYLRTTPEGAVLEEAYYRNDTLDGLRILYFTEGDTLSVETYDMGVFEGAFRQYYESGQLQIKGMYVDNEMTGKWRQYYENGQLMEVVSFEANQENGPFIEYHPNGALKAEGNYLDGDYEHGLLKLYDEQGMLVRKMNCEKGVCRTIWQVEGAAES